MWSHCAYGFCVAAFLLLQPAVFTRRLLRLSTASWARLTLWTSLVGWILANGAVYFYFEHLADLADRPNPPPEVLDRLLADGAKRTFALYFGWAYGLIYSIPSVAIACALRLVLRWWGQARPNKPQPPACAPSGARGCGKDVGQAEEAHE
jgi:hypothetical protein